MIHHGLFPSPGCIAGDVDRIVFCHVSPEGLIDNFKKPIKEVKDEKIRTDNSRYLNSM
jgi:hypothetical protein